MKKVLFAVIAIAALASCKKDYECRFTIGGSSYSQDYYDLTSAQADAQEVACTDAGGVWAVK